MNGDVAMVWCVHDVPKKGNKAAGNSDLVNRDDPRKQALQLTYGFPTVPVCAAFSRP